MFFVMMKVAFVLFEVINKFSKLLDLNNGGFVLDSLGGGCLGELVL